MLNIGDLEFTATVISVMGFNCALTPEEDLGND